ncbi:MAG: hypothetical protein MEQ74_04005 [Paracoccus sp.]|nr:hypothetical protein [Paracoccus sp. (in: a-proteobacteria)]
MPKLDLVNAQQIKSAAGEWLQAKAQGWSWAKPAAPPGDYDPDAEALFARFLTDPGTDRKDLINLQFIAGKATTWWSKLDALWVFAAHGPEAGRLNWLSTRFNCQPVNNPTFTVDRGYAGNGTNSYINTQFNPSVEAPLGAKFQLLDASFGIRCNSESTSASSIAGAWDGTTGITLNPRNNTSVAGRLNQRGQTSRTLPVATAIGLTAFTRNADAGPFVYKNGALLSGLGAAADTVLVNREVLLGGIMPTSLRANEFSFAFIGGALTVAEMESLYSWWETYKTAVGLS